MKWRRFCAILKTKSGNCEENNYPALDWTCSPHWERQGQHPTTVCKMSWKCRCIRNSVWTQEFQMAATQWCKSTLVKPPGLEMRNVFHRPQYKKVFETVRCASQSSLGSAESLGSLHSSMGGYVSSCSMPGGGGPRMSIMSQSSGGSGYERHRRPSSSIYSSSSLGYPSIDSTGQSDSESSLQTTDSEEGYP